MNRQLFGVVAAVLLFLAGVLLMAAQVDVDIYECSKVSDSGPIELEHYAVSCPQGEKPTSGSCVLKGTGNVPLTAVDSEDCS